MSNIDQEVKTGLNQMVFFPDITKLTKPIWLTISFFPAIWLYPLA